MSGVMSRSANPALKTGFDGPAAVTAPARTREIARERVQSRSMANKVVSFRVLRTVTTGRGYLGVRRSPPLWIAFLFFLCTEQSKDSPGRGRRKQSKAAGTAALQSSPARPICYSLLYLPLAEIQRAPLTPVRVDPLRGIPYYPARLAEVERLFASRWRMGWRKWVVRGLVFFALGGLTLAG